MRRPSERRTEDGVDQVITASDERHHEIGVGGTVVAQAGGLQTTRDRGARSVDERVGNSDRRLYPLESVVGAGKFAKDWRSEC